MTSLAERYEAAMSRFDSMIAQEQQEVEQFAVDSYAYTTDRLRPIEFCVDGFLANKVTVIAGPPGVGKTSLLVPMACIAAGLVKDHQITATLRRRVAYITEDPEQVERILYGMRKHGDIQCTDEELRYWFDVIPARRAPSDKVANLVENLRDEKREVAPAEQNHYLVEPLIVLDTSNATIDLDNENDNSQAGKAIAAIKEVLGTACLWIVAHTSKVATKDDVKTMSARGAGAFEGDANAVAYIINVENTRFMVLGKRRFEADFSEVRFVSESAFETVQTPWGSTQRIWYRYGLPVIAEEGERESLKTTIKEEASVEHRLALHGKIMASLADGQWKSGSQIRQVVNGKHETIVGMLRTLAETGHLEVKQGNRNATLYRAVA